MIGGRFDNGHMKVFGGVGVQVEIRKRLECKTRHSTAAFTRRRVTVAKAAMMQVRHLGTCISPRSRDEASDQGGKQIRFPRNLMEEDILPKRGWGTGQEVLTVSTHFHGGM